MKNIAWYRGIYPTGVSGTTYTVVPEDAGTWIVASVTKSDNTGITASVKVQEAEEPVFELESAEATKVNEIVATFAAPVDSDNVTIEVTKGTLSVPATVEWDLDEQTVTITTTARLTEGTYTITATDNVTDEETSIDVEVEKQYVKEIVITNDVALLDPNNKAIAYAYYDVLDQYGESMRASTTITWSASCTITTNKTNGKITLTKGAGNWVYNDQIFVTGVYAKTGANVQKTLTVGTEQALDSVEIAGFVKKNGTEIVDSLPAGFGSDEYLVLYSALDQNGDMMDCSTTFPVIGTDITFISNNILVINGVEKDANVLTAADTRSIGGITYGCAVVQPGMKVSEGGEVEITAIANKTGNKSTFDVTVGESAILASFVLSAPSDIIADGEKVEIPFTALDEDGNEITDFVTLAKQKTFNTLSFSTSNAGTLTLKEQADGSAVLIYDDAAAGPTFASAEATDGIDRVVSLTAIVAGGGTDNLMISVADRARPDAIADVRMDKVFVKGALIDKASDTNTNSLSLTSFKFIDQYGRAMGTWGKDNGFFANYKALTSVGSADYAGYAYGVRATYIGGGATTLLNKTALVANTDKFVLTSDNLAAEATRSAGIMNADVYAGHPDAQTSSGEAFKFDIVRAKAGDTDWDAVSTSKVHSYTVVDIKQLKALSIAELNKFYLKGAKTGDGIFGGTQAEFDTPTTFASGGRGLDTDAEYKQKVLVNGTYNGTKVNVPGIYYTVDGTKVTVTSETTKGDNVINTIGTLAYTDLYDKTTAKLTAKDATDTLVVKIYDPETETGAAWTTAAAPAGYVAGTLDTAQTEIVISDQDPKATTFVDLADTYTISDLLQTAFHQADSTTASQNYDDMVGAHNQGVAYRTGEDDVKWKVLDQYGVLVKDNATYKITNIVENAGGYASNNFTVSGNNSADVSVTGAERGDTFDCVITVGDLSKTVKVTVGADANAKIVNGVNTYLDTLIGTANTNGLEKQRLAGLK